MSYSRVFLSALVLYAGFLHVNAAQAQSAFELVRANETVSVLEIPGITGTAYNRPEGVISLDANNDGLDDLLMGPSNFLFEPELALALFVNLGEGRFVEDAAGVIDDLPLIGYLNHPSLVADFNGDGADDVFLIDQGLEVGMAPFDGKQPVLLLSSGTGGLINASNTNLPAMIDFHHSGAAGDFDNDGDVDIVINTLGELRAYLLVNDGFGDFSLEQEALPQSVIGTPQQVGDFMDVGAVTFIDANTDGLLDLIFGTYRNSPDLQLQVALQDSNGVFVDAQKMALAPTLNGQGIDLLLAEDLDGDGDQDFLVKIDSVGQPQGDLSQLEYTQGLYTFRNDGGEFIDVTKSWLGELEPETVGAHVELKDLNADGHIDLSFQIPLEVQEINRFLLLNDGKGRFFAPTNANVETPDFVQTGVKWTTDYDGDADFDVASLFANIDRVGDDFVQTDYEVVVLDKNALPYETAIEYPISADLSNNQLTLPVNIVGGDLLRVSFSITMDSQQVSIQLLSGSIVELEQTPTRFATFNPASGELFVPELAVDNSVEFVNAVFSLVDPLSGVFVLAEVLAN